MTNIKKRCKLCGADTPKVLFRLEKFNVLKCPSCSLVFRDVTLDPVSAKDLYSEKYFTEEQASYFFEHPREKERLFRNRLALVERHCPKKGSLLDIGCAVGTFLKIARDAGWKTKGVELSEFASRYAATKHGLDVMCGEFDRSKFPAGERFDVITMWDVVDHSEDPMKFLKDAAALLKDDGYLFVETTMEDGLVYEVSKWAYKLSGGLVKGPVTKGHPLHHSTFFSKSTLRKAIGSSGLTVETTAMCEYPAVFFPSGFFTRIAFMLISGIGDIIGRPLIVTFVCRKDVARR